MNAPSLYEFRERTPQLDVVEFDQPVEVTEKPLTDAEADQFRALLADRYRGVL